MNRIATVLYACTILLHIAWPLTDGANRTALTLTSVATFTIASLLHLSASVGHRRAAVAAAAVIMMGWLAEVIGINTGVLFGDYAYGPALQPQLAGVPLAVMCAWFMMAWPLNALVRRLWGDGRPFATAVMTGALLTAWDLFLDPQMVGERYWLWSDTSAAVPGTGIPASNYIWWFVVGTLVAFVLRRLTRAADITFLPISLILGWTVFSGVVGNAFFWQRPAVALWGGAAFAILGGILFVRRTAE